MQIETERLILLPLTYEQLKCWTDHSVKLEEELGVKYCGEPLAGVFAEIVNGQVIKTETDRENYMYHSFWFIIRKTDRVVVGSADFKDIPNENGEVEIGYGLGKEFEQQGYMTETVNAMCQWALAQNGVKCVLAETEIDGISSQNVLKRCGFHLFEKGETYWWSLSK